MHIISAQFSKTTNSCQKTTECVVFTTISSCFYLHYNYDTK